jgi:hypothetical protein
MAVDMQKREKMYSALFHMAQLETPFKLMRRQILKAGIWVEYYLY